MHPQLTDAIHVINNPDAKGKACDFQQHGLKLPTYTESIPLFPNYRLGKSNIDCTTSDKDLKREEIVRAVLKRVFNPLKNLNIIRVVKVGQYDADVIIGVALQIFRGQILGVLQLFNRRLNAGGNRFADRFGVIHIV